MIYALARLYLALVTGLVYWQVGSFHICTHNETDICSDRPPRERPVGKFEILVPDGGGPRIRRVSFIIGMPRYINVDCNTDLQEESCKLCCLVGLAKSSCLQSVPWFFIAALIQPNMQYRLGIRIRFLTSMEKRLCLPLPIKVCRHTC